MSTEAQRQTATANVRRVCVVVDLPRIRGFILFRFCFLYSLCVCVCSGDDDDFRMVCKQTCHAMQLAAAIVASQLRTKISSIQTNIRPEFAINVLSKPNVFRAWPKKFNEFRVVGGVGGTHTHTHTAQCMPYLSSVEFSGDARVANSRQFACVCCVLCVRI